MNSAYSIFVLRSSGPTSLDCTVKLKMLNTQLKAAEEAETELLQQKATESLFIEAEGYLEKSC